VIKDKLTVFVIRSLQPDADLLKCLKSFGYLIQEFHVIDRHFEINDREIRTEWYFVLYDNEYIQDSLIETIPVFMTWNNFDCFSLYKQIGEAPVNKASICPRMFRNTIKLSEFALYPELPSTRIETILNGWLYGNI